MNCFRTSFVLSLFFTCSCIFVTPPPVQRQPTQTGQNNNSSNGSNANSLQKISSLTLHGSTPSLSWSPDSRQVVTNSAFEYFGYENEIQSYKDQLGIYVVDVLSGSSSKPSSEQGYHPFWYNQNTIGWGHSPYEDGEAGLFLFSQENLSIRRIGRMEGVYHTLLAQNGSILFYSGFPEYEGWVYLSPEDGLIRKVSDQNAEDEWGESWNQPSEMVATQCFQQAGNAQVLMDGDQAELLVGERSIPLGALYTYGKNECPSEEKHCVAVKPCLSPDGNYVAYFTETPQLLGYTLHVSKVPQ